ncbi:MAG TPA: UDP-N-acetylglucosamine 2-epimerase [Bacteroidia bacterium]|nr:UDP-N-acetylglucosamine 2-epimerase [Bacteroidia bacterium]
MALKKKKIAVVTSTRADYGLLVPLLEGLSKDENIELELLVTGTHLLPEFGNTIDEILKDGYHVTQRVPIPMLSGSAADLSLTMGTALSEFGKVFRQIHPDLVVVLGDRYEIMAVAAAAVVSTLPVAHISGGEVTEGAFDEMFRHSITKMSQLHFTSTETYRKRVIQLGENPERVFNTGALALDNIRRQKLLTRDELTKQTGFVFNQHNILVTYHPETADSVSPLLRFGEFLEALHSFEQTSIMFTYPNTDSHGQELIRMIDDYVAQNPGKAWKSASLGMLRYLSMVKEVDVMAGNSSSGIIEAPCLGTPTVNIGDRQKGRIRSAGIIDCAPDKNSIVAALKKAMSAEFRKAMGNEKNPYGDGHAADRMKEIIATTDTSGLFAKQFYDLR